MQRKGKKRIVIPENQEELKARREADKQNIEEALTRVQERKIRAIETKSRMMMRWEEARRKTRRPRRQ